MEGRYRTSSSPERRSSRWMSSESSDRVPPGEEPPTGHPGHAHVAVSSTHDVHKAPLARSALRAARPLGQLTESQLQLFAPGAIPVRDTGGPGRRAGSGLALGSLPPNHSEPWIQVRSTDYWQTDSSGVPEVQRPAGLRALAHSD
ncbi:hypothetical protein G7Z17_g8517 [Cylindrodendrum hubeiense]|uniref:Uncharacterized protein n=1 Tax=Cylindrodendrum hubeiense TaxID=595255 RepID=A0A9P5LE92_9HYPO|nr:hypothetical protein G7Z17_g8517 [Cylindrodendrum hubeiense]